MYLVHRAKRGVTGADFQERSTQCQSCFVFPILSVGRFISAFLCPFPPKLGFLLPAVDKGYKENGRKKVFFDSCPGHIFTFARPCKDPSLSISERDALRSWCNDIVPFLTPQEIPKYAWESARLSEILPNNASTKLLRHVVNTINAETQEGTAFDTYGDTGLLRSFVHIIRQRGNPTSDNHKILEPFFPNMKHRLASAIDQSILEEQYEVTCTLCIVVDAMADVSMSGISHENLYSPLIGFQVRIQSFIWPSLPRMLHRPCAALKIMTRSAKPLCVDWSGSLTLR